jgi:RNA polymerase sigma factor (sigma-70 family)
LKEEELFLLCQRQDPKAQEYLYDKYSLGLMKLCFRYLKDEYEAEEALVKGFYKVFTSVKKVEWRGKGAFSSWIKRVMVNECLMAIRKNKIKSTVDLGDLRLSNNDYAENGLLEEELYKIIAELPDGYRTVFNLYVVEGYNHREIGEMLEIQESTSKSQLSKARKHLKNRIKELNMD